MAEVQPFRGIRYDISQVGDLSDVTAPPYDVINPAQQQALYERHPCNVIRLILNRDEPGDADPDARYARAAQFFRNWQREGVLMRDREDALYVYHQLFEWEGRHYVRKGFLGRLRLEEFGQGKVFPHEETLSGPKADRLKLTKACRANLSPIFGLYPDPDNLVQQPLEDAVAARPALQARDDLGVIHRLWPVSHHETIAAVRDRLQDKPIFIADGHHRYETALNYRRFLVEQGRPPGPADAANFVLMMFVGMSDPGLAILPTHRLVSGLPPLNADDLRAALQTHCQLEAVGQGSAAAQECWERILIDGGQNVFGFATASDGAWQFARITDASPMAALAADHSEAWRGLGVSLLHKLVLEHLLASRYPEVAPQFQYVHLLEEVDTAVSRRSCQLACLVPAAGIEHVEQIASQLEKMPPKSTYFYPKLLSGLVIHSLEG